MRICTTLVPSLFIAETSFLAVKKGSLTLCFQIKMMCAREHMEKLSNPAFQAAIKVCSSLSLFPFIHLALKNTILLQKLYEQKEGLTEWQLRLLEWYLLEIKACSIFSLFRLHAGFFE